jgi:uncharacterized protein (DUF58 family)
MKTEELIKQVRRIQIKTNRLVDEAIGGDYHSAFKGKGLEFAEVREYFPGDDVRNIDWNVTARMGHPFIKRFVEERELTIILIADLSSSMSFGNDIRLKKDTMAEISALIGFSAIKNNDRIGMITFSDKVESYIPPRKGVKTVLRLVRDMLETEGKGKTSIKVALERLMTVQKKKAVVFLLSDFHEKNGNFFKELSHAAIKYDLIPVKINAPLEQQLPKGVVSVLPLEGSGQRVIDFSSKKVKKQFEEAKRSHEKELFEKFSKLGLDYIEVQCGDDIFNAFHKFFISRKRKLVR